MADNNAFDLGIGTKADLDELEKGLKDIENKVKESEENQNNNFKKYGKQQTDTTNKTEKDKTKIVEKESKKRTGIFNKEGKSSLDSIKGFAQGAAGQIAGLDQVLGAVAGGPVAMGAAFAKMGKQAIDTLNQWADASIEAKRVQDALNAVVESTGAKAWTTASTLNKLARDQSDATGRSLEEITRAQTALLGYTNITKDLFADTTQAALNMAQVTGTDMKSAVESLGKALDVPSMGLSALTRQGFRFNEQQKEMVKTLEKAGKLEEAQRVILDQVINTYNKAATAVDPAVKAQNAFNNELKEYQMRMGQDWERITRSWKIHITAYLKNINDAKRATEGLKNAIKILEEDSSVSLNTLQAQVEATRARIALVSVKLEEQTAPLWKKLLVYNDTLLKDTESWSAMYNEYINESNKYLAKLEQQAGLLGDIENIVDRTDTIMQATDTLEAVENHNKALQLKEELLKELESLNADINITENMGYYKRIELIKKTIGLNDDLVASMREKIKTLTRTIEKEETEIKIAKSAAKYREENQEALDAEIAKILRRAEIEGKDKDSLEVKKQILDAEVQAYENLLVAAKEVIDGTAPEEQAQLARLKEKWKLYSDQAELEKRTDEERKKRLNDLLKLQEETQSKLNKIIEDAVTEKDKLYDTQKEQAYQDELTDIRKKSAVKAVNFEAEYKQRQIEIEYQNQLAEIANNETLQRERLARIRDAEIKTAGNNSALKKDIEKKYNEEILNLDENLNLARQQLDANFQEQKRQAEKKTVKAIEQAHVEMYQRLLSLAETYLSASKSIASSISTIWTKNIEYQLNEDLKANDKRIQSDEERAAAEKELQMESALLQYKAQLFQYASNVVLANAQAALAVLSELSQGDPYTKTARAIAAGIQGAFQVAAVIAAKPQAPRFHSGGVVQGSGEKSAILKGGEVVQTQRQFQNTMQAISNLASNKTGNGGIQMNVKVENNASGLVSATPQITEEGLIVVVEQIMQNSFESGRMDNSISVQQSNKAGRSIL